jgi:dTDP-4-dehydrorhamnose reductase
MKFAVIGVGFLGRKFLEYFGRENEVVGASEIPSENVQKLDATNREEVETFLEKEMPDVVIDTVGLTSSVACERDPELAERLNYSTAKIIADSCKKIGAKMVFISSSYLFDGEKGNYTEEDIPNSEMQYSKTKILAEKEVLSVPGSIVIRTEIMYGTENKKIKFGSATFEGEVSLAFTDQIRQPIFVDDVPKIVNELLKNKHSGIFNTAGPEKMTMLTLLQRLENLFRDKSEIIIKDKSVLPMKFPDDSSLDISKIVSLGINPTPIEDALEIIKVQI